MARGAALGAFGLTEPEGLGPDARAIRTTARLESSEWGLRRHEGLHHERRTPLTSVHVAARGRGGRDARRIVVPVDTPGFSVGPPYRSVGWRASDTREVVLQRCRVPEDHLLGDARVPPSSSRCSTTAVAVAAPSPSASRAGARGERAPGDRPPRVRPPSDARVRGRGVQASPICAWPSRPAVSAYQRPPGCAITGAASRPRRRSPSSPRARRPSPAPATPFRSTAATATSRRRRSPGSYWDAAMPEIGEGTSETQRVVVARDLGLPLT